MRCELHLNNKNAIRDLFLLLIMHFLHMSLGGLEHCHNWTFLLLYE